MNSRKKKNHPASILELFKALRLQNQCAKGIVALVLSLLALSILASANFESAPKIYMAGEVADSDIISDRRMQVEDATATKARIKKIQAMQPPVYDYTLQPYNQFQTTLEEVFNALNQEGINYKNPVLEKLSEEIGRSTAEEIFPVLSKKDIQNYLLKKILPHIRSQMENGLLSDIRTTRGGRSGIMIRNLESGLDSFRPEIQSIMDARTFLGEISSQLRHSPELTGQDRSAINTFLSALLPVSLTFNQEATKQRVEAATASVTPVFYPIEKGELLLRKGERVSREQELMLQAVYNSIADPIHLNKVAGAFLLSLVISLGLFMAPSGKQGHPVHCKDLYLISVVLLFFGICAKGAHIFGLHMDNIIILKSCAAAFPVAGAVGLVAMVFSARRYGTMGLLLSFFPMLMFKESFPLFILYFLGGMLSTWLVSRSQNRQDVVWSVVPLSIGMLVIGTGCFLLTQGSLAELTWQLIAVIISALLSLIILFTFSPILELAFGYSTRFRLMELMSLEQPLMQEIMVTIPGTYHHSLVVANMVEAGAKAIGANSLLCKVAALYHDAGKLSYPDYFIENQFGAPNKHDKLSPSMSALILHSHVKKGTELAEKYKLGQEIADIIRQHHGTRMMRFFYQKAINLGENPNESDYSYPGPKPQTKEAAILMLADSVEASSRTLTDPTPARLKNHIDSIIKGIFSEGQLDESELTFKDLHFLSETFQRILTGIFHQRIVYPDSKLKNSSNSGEKNQQNGKDNSQAPASVRT